MLSPTLETALNQQINLELSSSYAYLAAAAYFESVNLEGCARWMHHQSEEEREHAMKFFAHILDRGGRVQLAAIAAPHSEFASALQVFETALAHEHKVTRAIHALYDLARQENDYPAQVLLQWFVTEQVEEEKSVTSIIERLKMAGDSPTALLMLDSALGQRRED